MMALLTLLSSFAHWPLMIYSTDDSQTRLNTTFLIDEEFVFVKLYGKFQSGLWILYNWEVNVK